MIWPARTLGALTVGYGVAVAVAPRVLAGPCGLTEPDGSVTPGTATLCRAIGARDAASGLAMMVAPAGSALKWATVVRVAADVGDAVGLGVSLPSPDARRKAAIVAGTWGALTALAGAVSRGRRH